MKATIKTVLSVVLSYLMVISVLPLSVLSTSAADINLQGEGTQDSPYRIYSAEDFVYAMSAYGSNDEVYLSLENDIDIREQYQSITSFAAFLNGNNHTIIANDKFADKNSGTVSGLVYKNQKDYTASTGSNGGFVDTNTGLLSGVFVHAEMKGSKCAIICYENRGNIFNCAAFGSVNTYNSDGSIAAGIAAYGTGLTANCYVVASVIATGSSRYGVSHSYPVSVGKIENSYFDSSVCSIDSASGYSSEYMKSNDFITLLNTDVQASDSLWTQDVEERNNGYPVLKPAFNAKIKCSKTNRLIIDTESVELFSEDGAEIHYSTDGSVPNSSSNLYTDPIEISDTVTIKAVGYKNGLSGKSVEFSFAKIKGSGTEESPYLIDCEAAFLAIPELSLTACYKLNTDITLTTAFETFGDFYGVLDGNNHTINSIWSNTYQYGLFRKNFGLIQNLALTSDNLNFKTNGAFSYQNYGVITNCAFNGRITGFVPSNYEYYRDKSGKEFYGLGGFVSFNYGTVSNSCFVGNLDVTEGNTIGGFIGVNDSKIINCIFQGDIYVDDLHFFGSSEYTNKTGGFVGLNTTSGTVEHSSANTDSIYVRTFSYAGGTAYTFGYLQRAQTECSCTNNRIFFEANYLEWGGRETVRQDFDGEGYQKNAHKHQYQMTSVLPTCTEEGTVSYLCESCSDVIEEQSIPAMGHKYGEELIVTPTYEERGYTHKICSRCGYDYKYNYVEAYKIETGSCGSNATYTMDTGKGTVIISGTGAINNYNSGYNSIKKVYRTTAPWGSYDIKSVVIEDGITSIGNYAFFRNEEIEEVSLPSTLQSVGTSAFYGAALSSLELPQGLTTISNSALGGIKKLTEIEIPDSVTDIGKTAFTGCTNLERVTLPCSAVLANSTDNYNDVFYNCNKLNTLYFTKGTGSMPDYETVSPFKAISGTLTEVSFAEGVDYIGQNTFRDCSKLETVNMPLTQPVIGKDAFKGTPYYKSTFDEKGLIISGTILCDGMYAEGDVVIPDGITEISNDAFKNNKNITSIIIPESVKTVGASVFYGCTGLSSLTVPCDLDLYFDDNSFYGVTHLTRLTMTKGSGVMLSFGSKYLYTPWFRSSAVFSTINLEEGITEIGSSAFRDLPNLTSVSIPSSVTRLGTYAFSGDSSIQSIALPDGFDYFGAAALNNCTGLKELTLPCSTRFANNANNFGNCTNIEKITLTKGTGVMPSYKDIFRLTPWYISRVNLKQLVLEDGIENIGAFMFIYNSSLTDLEMPNSIKTIGASAFDHCTSLNRLIIPKGVTEIQSSAFNGCSKLNEIVFLGNCLDSVGSSAFSTTNKKQRMYFIDKNCVINAAGNVLPTIAGYAKSTAQAYAETYSKTFFEIIGQCSECDSYNLTRKTVEPTCTLDGYYEYSCGSCGYHYTEDGDLPAKGHTLVTDDDKPATCTDTGLTAGLHCSVCGEVFKEQEIIPTTGHTTVIDKAKPATCTKTGLTEGSHCSVCGEVIKAQEIIPATGHTAVIDKGKAPTCTETGLTEGSHCSVCGEVIKAQEIISATGHTVVIDKAKPATCTKTGLTEGSHCSVCGEVIIAQEIIPAIGHTIAIDDAVPATCTHTGLTSGAHCSVCGEILVAQEVVPMAEHTIVIDNAKTPTCTETGLTEGSHCSVCGEVIKAQSVIPATGHTEVIDKGKAPTCTETGLTDGSHCSVCGEVIKAQSVIPATGHTEVIDKAKPATCTESGLTEGSHCSVCGEIIKAQEIIPATGHDWDNGTVTKAADCHHDGEMTYSCSKCQEKKTEVIPMLEHQWNDGTVTKEPTYTEPGEIKYTCSLCGDTRTESVPCKEKKGKLTISNETVRAGDEVTVKLYLDENPGITALSINVNFPNRFILKDVQYMGLFPNQPSSSPMNYNPFTVSWASPTSTDIDNTGLFAILTFDVGIDVPLADYPITVTYNAENVFDSAFVNVPLDIDNSTVSVLKPTPGDVNRDGNINMKDLVLIQQLINRWDVQIVESAADVNDDGEINMKDLVLLQRYINGWEVVLK